MAGARASNSRDLPVYPVAENCVLMYNAIAHKLTLENPVTLHGASPLALRNGGIWG